MAVPAGYLITNLSDVQINLISPDRGSRVDSFDENAEYIGYSSSGTIRLFPRENITLPENIYLKQVGDTYSLFINAELTVPVSLRGVNRIVASTTGSLPLFITTYSGTGNIQYTDNLILLNVSDVTVWFDGEIIYHPTEPIDYHFKPISYLRSPLNHLKLSMIKEEYTNGGEPVSMVDRDINIERITPESNIGVLAKNTIIGGRKVVGWTANNKYVAIHRLPDNPEYPSLISFEIEHYIDGQIVNGLTTTITGFPVGDTMNLYFSYIIDEENEAARLSIIRIDHVGGLYTAYYNQETVTAEQYTSYYEWLSGGYMFGEPENPYEWGTPSEESDGDGTHDRTSDTIGEPETPAVGVSDAGFITLYTPTYNQINSLASYMWSELDITNLRRLFADPMDCLISLNILPFSIDASGQKEIFVGNIGTGVTANVAASQWKTINMGSIDVAEFFAGYMDYSPYTKIEMYLPYIGMVNLNPDDVMYSTITLKYKVDILTGACVAYLMVDRAGDDQHTAVSAPLYTFTGNCAISIPVTAASYGSVFQSIIGMAATAGTVGAAAITGGMSAPVALGAAATLSTNAMNMKPDVSRSGVMGSTAGFLNQQHAYLIVTRPNQCRAAQQEKYTGFPAHIAYTLNTLSGYTEIESIHLEGIPCTESEYTEIENLLKGGVII